MLQRLFAMFLLTTILKISTAAASDTWPDKNAPRNTVVIRLGEHFAVEYERAVDPKVTIFVGPAAFVAYSTANGVDRSELGLGGTIGARFFVSGLAPEGLFVGPLLTASYSTVREGAERRHGMRITSGAMIGYTWIFANAFDLSLGAGANYVNATRSQDGASPPGPVEASLRAAVGVAF